MFDGEVQKFRVVIAGDRRLDVEGVVKILSAEPEKVCFRVPGKVLEIEGKDLVFVRIERGFVSLRGIFYGVRLSGQEASA